MNKEEKDLLLEDLCGRLPYGVKCEVDGCAEPLVLDSILYCDTFVLGVRERYISQIKPYLRPMESMTEEERAEYSSISHSGKVWLIKYWDWLNAHHFDYRGLIEKGLAIAVTEDNNPYK